MDFTVGVFAAVARFGVKFARSPETDKLVEYIVKSPRLKNAT